MKELWKVFKDSATGQELAAYTIRGTFQGEEQATKELIAEEKGINPDRIKTVLEER